MIFRQLFRIPWIKTSRYILSNSHLLMSLIHAGPPVHTCSYLCCKYIKQNWHVSRASDWVAKVCTKKKEKKTDVRRSNEGACRCNYWRSCKSRFSSTYQEYCAHHHSRHCDLNSATWRTFSSGSSWTVTCCDFAPCVLKPRSRFPSELYDVRNTHNVH